MRSVSEIGVLRIYVEGVLNDTGRVWWFVRMRGVGGMDTLPVENCGKQGLSIYSLRNTFIRSHKGFKFFSLISHSHTTM